MKTFSNQDFLIGNTMGVDFPYMINQEKDVYEIFFDLDNNVSIDLIQDIYAFVMKSNKKKKNVDIYNYASHVDVYKNLGAINMDANIASIYIDFSDYLGYSYGNEIEYMLDKKELLFESFSSMFLKTDFHYAYNYKKNAKKAEKKRKDKKRCLEFEKILINFDNRVNKVLKENFYKGDVE